MSRSAASRLRARAPPAGEVVGDLLDQLAGGGGDAVQAAEEHDLAGQVVDLGAAGPAGDALPRGATGRGGTGRGAAGCRPVAPCPASAVTSGIPAARIAASPSASARRASSSAASPSTQAASTPLPTFISSLRYFQAMMSDRGDRREPGVAEVGGDRPGQVVGALGHPAEVEDARDGMALGDDHPGLEMGRGQHHAHARRPGRTAAAPRARSRRRWSRRRSACRRVRGRRGRRGRQPPGGTSPPAGRPCRCPSRRRRRCRWPGLRSRACRCPCPAAVRPPGSAPGARRGRPGWSVAGEGEMSPITPPTAPAP